MKKIALLCALLLALSPLSGCARSGDFFAPFRGGLRAEITGSLRGVALSAQVELSPLGEGEACTAGTITFYAPRALAGTVLARDPQGGLTLTAGTLTRPAPQALGALFDLFPTAGEVCAVSREGDLTVVTGEGFCFSLDGEGNPAALSGDAAEMQVLSFERTNPT